MALTPFYGLSYFGGNTPGALTDDGSKFTGSDRILLDRMLHALATGSRHVRDYDSISDPDAPTAVVGTDGGLPGGSTYHYVVTYFDEDGLESLPSEEATVTTPDVLVEPDEPALDDEDELGLSLTGTLPAGLYFYALTALRGGEESGLGTQISLTTLDTGGIRVTLPAPPPGAVTAQVWRMSADDIGWTRVGQIPFVESNHFDDDGSVPANPNADDPAQQPPISNSGEDVYSVTVTLAVADQHLVTDKKITAWRLYRTETSGAYPAASLVHHVVDLDDPLDSGDPDLPLVVAWVDEGDVLIDGVPPMTSQSLQLTPYTFDTVATLPPYLEYPVGYPLVYAGQLHIRGNAGWVPVAGGGGSGEVVIFAQDTPETTWTIPHTFPYWPAVALTDSAGRQVTADVQHADGVVTVTADIAFAGKAHLS